MSSVKPKKFSEVYPNESVSLVDALVKTTNHELLLCGKCNEPIPTQNLSFKEIKFCIKCGTKIDWSDRHKSLTKSKICSKCFKSFIDDDSFCYECGIKLTEQIKQKDSSF